MLQLKISEWQVNLHKSLSDLTKNDEEMCNSYTTVCPPVLGDNPRALGSGLSLVQVEKPWKSYFIPPSSV